MSVYKGRNGLFRMPLNLIHFPSNVLHKNIGKLSLIYFIKQIQRPQRGYRL